MGLALTRTAKGYSMSLYLVTAPTIEPVTVEEAKGTARVDITADDGLIYSLIVTARTLAETITGRQMVTATYRQKLDRFPSAAINGQLYLELPKPPLQSVSSITYVDTAGDTQTLSSDLYTVDTDSEPGRVILDYGESWPSTRDVAQAVTITFVAGYAITSYTADTISADDTGDTIDDSADGLGDFAVHDWVTVSGFSTAANNGNFIITGASASSLAVDSSLTAEIAGASVSVQKPTTPRAIRDWIKIQVATMYDNPEAVVIGAAAAPIPRNFVDALLDPYRRIKV